MRIAIENKVDLLFPGDHKTFLHRQLKRRAMNNYFDLRGSRRLSILCDFVHKVYINDDDNPLNDMA